MRLMYKHAWGLRNDDSYERKPLPRHVWRSRYYSAIAQDAKTGKVFGRHHKTAPNWLKAEVRKFTPEKWLKYWSKKTGLPNNSKRGRPRI